jgi:hypothetical protein
MKRREGMDRPPFSRRSTKYAIGLQMKVRPIKAPQDLRQNLLGPNRATLHTEGKEAALRGLQALNYNTGVVLDDDDDDDDDDIDRARYSSINIRDR